MCQLNTDPMKSQVSVIFPLPSSDFFYFPPGWEKFFSLSDNLMIRKKVIFWQNHSKHRKKVFFSLYFTFNLRWRSGESYSIVIRAGDDEKWNYKWQIGKHDENWIYFCFPQIHFGNLWYLFVSLRQGKEENFLSRTLMLLRRFVSEMSPYSCWKFLKYFLSAVLLNEHFRLDILTWWSHLTLFPKRRHQMLLCLKAALLN